MEPVGMDLASRGCGPLERQPNGDAGTLAWKAPHVKSASQKGHPLHHSHQAEGIASLQRLFDPKTDSIVTYAKFNRMIGRSQANVYGRRGRMFSNVVKT